MAAPASSSHGSVSNGNGVGVVHAVEEEDMSNWSSATLGGIEPEESDGVTMARNECSVGSDGPTARPRSDESLSSSAGVRLVEGGSGGLLSLRPRPRTISTAQTSLLMRLSRLHLDWHISAYPNCMYALRRVGGVSVKAEKTLLLLDLHATFAGSEGGRSTGRLLMVEKESAVKVILFDSLVSVSVLTPDTLRLIYWFDPMQRALAMGAGAAARTPAAKQYMLVLTFASHLDARDVAALLAHVIKHPLAQDTDTRSPFRAPRGPSTGAGAGAAAAASPGGGGPAEFVCVHSGWLEKKGKYSWSHRFARLYAGGRLTIFRSDKSPFPVNVLSMPCGAGETRLVPRQMGKDQICFEFSTVKAPGMGAAALSSAAATTTTAATTTPPSQQANGLNTASPLSPPAAASPSPTQSPSSAATTVAAGAAAAAASPTSTPATAAPAAVPAPVAAVSVAPPSPTLFSTLLRFETQRERDRWFHALKLDFDQPIKETLRSPSSATQTTGQATSPTSAAATVVATTASTPAPAAVPAAAADVPAAATGDSTSATTTATTTTSPAATDLAPTPSVTPAPAPVPTPTPTPDPSSDAVELHLKLAATDLPPPPVPTVQPSSNGVGGSATSSTTSLHYARTSTVTLRQTSSPGRIAVTGPPPSGIVRALPMRLSPAEAAAAAERNAVLAHSYYLQLLTLLASPEVLRLPADAEEILIPLNPSCGPVNVTQLSKHSAGAAAAAMPHASNPRSAAGGAKATSPHAANGTAPTSAASPTAASSPLPSPTSSSPSPSSAAPLNPATHQRISVTSLLQRVCNQQPFFHFLSTVRTRHSSLLLRTTLPPLAQFQTSTPSTSIFKMGKRGLSLQCIDACLSRYHALLQIELQLLERSKLLLVESGAPGSGNSTSSQIAFSWEGFDSQVFDVGPFAVVSPAQMWRGGETAFDELEWSQALKASCVGKELMQSSADLTALFESDAQEDQHRARTLMHQAQLEVLHNIALAAHMRARRNANRERLREGEVVYWSAVLTQFEFGGVGSIFDAAESANSPSKSASPSPVPSPRSAGAGGADPSTTGTTASSAAECLLSDAEMFQYSRNLMQLEQFYELQYVYAPSKTLMTHFIRAKLDQWERDSGVGSTGGGGGGVGGGGLYGASADSTPALGPESPRESPRRSPRRDADIEYAPNLASATSGAGAGGGVGVAASVGGAYSPNRQFLFDAFHYLLFLRLLLDHRKTLLERLENAVHEWLGRYQKDASKNTSTPKFDAITRFKLLVEGEKRALVAALADLPHSDVVEAVIKLQSRTHTHHALQHSLPLRPAPHDPQLQRCGAGVGVGVVVGAMLTPDQLEQRSHALLQRKSVLLQHVSSRLQVSSPTHAALTVVTSPPPIHGHGHAHANNHSHSHSRADDLTPPTSSRVRARAAISKEAPY